MRIHFIAIGGSAMHNLALALHQKGYKISGSDDQIFEPSYSRLKTKGLLPSSEGWNPERITTALDAVILGMHAHKENPELLKAQELGIPIFSYPEYIYEQSKNKTRIVIGGSHGKTTITSMIMHVLQSLKIDFDYLVGAQIEGFETMVRISDAPYMIIEGDEYLASALQPYPKFHFYHAHIAVISGLAWDHINVFPTFANYQAQFDKFIDTICPNGTLIYCAEDQGLENMVSTHVFKQELTVKAYRSPEHIIENYQTYITENQQKIALQVFGNHNLLNLQAAKHVCLQLGISETNFWNAAQGFKGASKRLEIWKTGTDFCIFRDFAHAPSKIKASIEAVKKQYPDRKLISCLELHTFSSLNNFFLSEYKDTTHESDIFIVYVNKKVLHKKGITSFTQEEMTIFFNRTDIFYLEDKELLVETLATLNDHQTNILMMSSGNFDGLKLEDLSLF